MTDYATLLRDHVTLTCRSVDRFFLQGYVPKLQSVGLVCRFLRSQRGFKIPSSAAFGRIGNAYVKDIHRFAESHGIPVVYFKKGESKEQLARPLIDAAAAEGGDGRVVLVGIAQEKASVWRSWPAKGQENAAHPHMEWGRQMAFVNHFYFYLWDPDWGPAFIKTNAYAPWPIWIYLNGHEWAKRQLERAGIGYEALDNGFRSCEDPVALQRICDRLGSGAVKSFLWRWQRRLPSPFTDTDRRAGYVYELAFRQFEMSETQVFDRPQAGRAFFEGLIRDLDVGRPDQIALIFDRRVTRKTPGSFRTKVITRGVDPELCCYYKSSRIKQYFKEHRALRTETVISDTRDFGIGRRVNAENWHALRAVGQAANRRLCDAEASDASPAPDVATFEQVTLPSDDADGLHAPGLRFGDRRVMAVLAVIVGFAHLPAGFTNRQLTELVGAVLDDRPYTSRQATYDLRRLKRKEIIERIPHSHRYQITGFGRRVAVLFTKAHSRVLAPGLAWLDPQLPDDISARSPLAIVWRQLDKTLDRFIDNAMIAA